VLTLWPAPRITRHDNFDRRGPGSCPPRPSAAGPSGGVAGAAAGGRRGGDARSAAADARTADQDDYRLPAMAAPHEIQTDAHNNKLLDRLTANEELITYVQSPAGQRFLESAPISMEGPRAIAAPIGRIRDAHDGRADVSGLLRTNGPSTLGVAVAPDRRPTRGGRPPAGKLLPLPARRPRLRERRASAPLPVPDCNEPGVGPFDSRRSLMARARQKRPPSRQRLRRIW
jgi:hypothetical protein